MEIQRKVRKIRTDYRVESIEKISKILEVIADHFLEVIAENGPKSETKLLGKVPDFG